MANVFNKSYHPTCWFWFLFSRLDAAELAFDSEGDDDGATEPPLKNISVLFQTTG